MAKSPKIKHSSSHLKKLEVSIGKRRNYSVVPNFISPTFKQCNMGINYSEPKMLTKVGIQTLNSLFIKRLLYQEHESRDFSKTQHKDSAVQSPPESVLEMRSEQKQKYMPITDKQSKFLKMIKFNFLKRE